MELIERTDEEIVRDVQRGDGEAFGILVFRYQPKLSRYARKFLFRGDDINDIVQDTFIKAYTNIKSFDVERRFSPWIYRIAHNVFVNAGRDSLRNRAHFSIFDADVLFPSPVAVEKADDAAKHEEMKRMLDTSLAAIDKKYREPLVLYYFEDLDYKTIADVLQIPMSTIATRIKRGKSMLEKIIKP
jgi:RNA polymerase sigma-70 factor, ECF subfamily